METTTAVIRGRIKSWMSETIRAGNHRRFADLHIDQVHASFKSKEAWIRGSNVCLQVAIHLRNEHAWPVIAAIGMSLESDSLPRGITFSSDEELATELDPSPPSLYLFDPSSPPWKMDSRIKEIEGVVRYPGDIEARKYFHEWWDDNDGEFRRTLWIAG